MVVIPELFLRALSRLSRVSLEVACREQKAIQHYLVLRRVTTDEAVAARYTTHAHHYAGPTTLQMSNPTNLTGTRGQEDPHIGMLWYRMSD